MDVEFCQMLFPYQLRWSCAFCLFLMCMTLICICELSLWFGINTAWLWYIIFLCVVRFGLLIFCWEFLHLYSLQILGCNFLYFSGVFVWFWCQAESDMTEQLNWTDGGFIEFCWEYSNVFEVWEGSVYVLFMFGRICLWNHMVLDVCL